MRFSFSFIARRHIRASEGAAARVRRDLDQIFAEPNETN